MSMRIRSGLTNFLHLFPIIFAAFLIAGCSGSGGASSPVPASTLSPADIALSTNQIAFGNVVVGQFADRSVSVSNTGALPLNIGQIAQGVQAATPFSIQEDTCSLKTLRAAETCSLTIRFSPPAQGGFTDTFNIPSNDPDEATLAVNVSGDGNSLNVTLNRIDIEGCPVVRLIVSVTEGSNAPVKGLIADNFTVRENGIVKPIIPASFSSSITTPISFGLAVDQSHSVTRNQATRTAVTNAVKGFIDSMQGTDEAGLVKFAREFELSQPPGFTTNKIALKDAMDAGYPDALGDATFLYDAANFTVDQVDTRTNDRRTAIILSDFNDFDSVTQQDGSVSTLGDVISNALGKGISIYTIGLGNIDIPTMQTMAAETGGQSFLADSPEGLGAIYAQISEILTNQYIIEFTSTLSGPSIIDIEVKVPPDGSGLQGLDTRDSPGCP